MSVFSRKCFQGRVVMRLLLLLMVCLLVACESDNEHFCARYHYVFNQLLEEDDLPSYSEMKQQLISNISNPNKEQEQARFMLFVLEDWYNEIKPEGEDPRAFCMRMQRWQAYP